MRKHRLPQVSIGPRVPIISNRGWAEELWGRGKSGRGKSGLLWLTHVFWFFAIYWPEYCRIMLVCCYPETSLIVLYKLWNNTKLIIWKTLYQKRGSLSFVNELWQFAFQFPNPNFDYNNVRTLQDSLKWTSTGRDKL